MEDDSRSDLTAGNGLTGIEVEIDDEAAGEAKTEENGDRNNERNEPESRPAKDTRDKITLWDCMEPEGKCGKQEREYSTR